VRQGFLPQHVMAYEVGRVKYEWQERSFVLAWFGQRESRAVAEYGEYMEPGIPQAEVARLLGVTTPAIAKALKRTGSD